MTTFRITIETPCQENPDHFDKTKNGGFCRSCQKEVIDFSDMSDEEIRAYFSKTNSRNFCGSFRESQLKNYESSKRRSYSLLKMVTIGSLLTVSPVTIMAQQKETPKTHQSQTGQKENPEVISPEFRTIKGRILWRPDSSAIIGATVLLEGTKIGAITDLDGYFSFDIPSSVKEQWLVFSYYGMKTERRNLHFLPDETLIVTLEEDLEVLSEVIVVGGACVHYKTFSLRNWFGVRSVWRGIKRLFRG